MPSNNSKYSPEMREQTARFILESDRSATTGELVEAQATREGDQTKGSAACRGAREGRDPKKSLHIFMQPQR